MDKFIGILYKNRLWYLRYVSHNGLTLYAPCRVILNVLASYVRIKKETSTKMYTPF